MKFNSWNGEAYRENYLWGRFILVALLLLLPLPSFAQTNVRVVHGVPDAPGVDVYVDGTTPALISNLTFRTTSSLAALYPGERNFKVAATGTPMSAAIINVTATLGQDSSYTVIAVGTLSSLMVEPLLLGRKTNLSVPDGKAWVRVVHASPDAGAVDIKITDANGGVVTLANTGFKAATDYTELPAGAINVEIAPVGGATMYRAKGVLPAKGVLTVLATGRLSQPGEFKLNVLNDTEAAAQDPMAALEPITSVEPSVRLVHLSPAAPGVDVFVDNTSPAAISNLMFRAATDLQKLPAGTRNVKVGATGAPISSAIINADVVLNADSIYTVYAVGTINPFSIAPLILTRYAKATVPTGKTWVRVLHASPDFGNADLTITPSQGEPIKLDNVPFKGTTEYIELPSGNVRVDVAAAGGVLSYSAGGVLPAGAILTVAATGRATINSEEFHLSVIDDTGGEQKPLGALQPIIEQPEAGIRVIHTSPDAPNVDVFVDGTLSPIQNLAFRNATAIASLPAGSRNIKVSPASAGIGAAVINADVSLAADTVYSVYAIGGIDAGNFRPIVLTRAKEISPSSGTALVRVLHASPDAGAVDLKITDANGQTTTLTSVPFAANTGYLTLPAGNVTVKVAPAGGQVIYTASGNLPAGAVITVAAVGRLAISDEFKLNVVVDSDSNPQVPLAALQVPTSSVNTEVIPSSALNLRPNPATSVVNLKLDGLIGTEFRAVVVDALGKSILTQQLDASNTTLSVNQLPTGLYRVLLTNETGRIVASSSISIIR